MFLTTGNFLHGQLSQLKPCWQLQYQVIAYITVPVTVCADFFLAQIMLSLLLFISLHTEHSENASGPTVFPLVFIK